MRNVGSWRLPAAAALATVLATICLGATFLRPTWFFPSVLAIVLTGAGCELARRNRAGRPWVPLGGAAALLGYLMLRYGHEQSLGHVIPTTATLERLQELAAGGRADIARYAAPIGVSPGIEFVTVAGVGLVALVVDTLAVTWRRAALAGLPLLVLFTVPTAFAPDGVGWVAFTLAAIGFLTLLLTESRERVSRWGHGVSNVQSKRNWVPDVETSPLSQVGRRVGATALGIALVVPAVLPDLDGIGGFGSGNGPLGGGGGGSKVTVVNPILTMGRDLRRPDNRPVLAYTGAPTYIRLVGLDQFTGSTWRPSELEVSREDNDVEKGIARPPGLSRGIATSTARYRFETFDFEQAWLPLPYPAQRVLDIEGTWLYDRNTFNVFGENTSTFELSYGVRVLNVQPTVEQLRAAPSPPVSVARYMRLPSDLPPDVEATARDVVGNAPTNYDKALALQQWFRSDQFVYSTEVSDTLGDSNGAEVIAAFLESRQGYCVHFASAMAVMARTLGIPARVATGFLPGTEDPSRPNTFVVSIHDLHSWPELYFQGVGWVRFEPTPAIRTGEAPSYAQAEVGGLPGSGSPDSSRPDSVGGQDGAPQSARAAERVRALERGLDAQVPSGGPGATPTEGGGLPRWPLGIGLGLLVLLTVPALARWAVRRSRWSGAGSPVEQARAAWADLQDTLTDIGYSWRESDSPRAGVERLVAERRMTPKPAAAVRRLAAATERARYAPTMAGVGDLRADASAVRSGLLTTSSPRTRWRARLLPRSTRSLLHAVGERMADALDTLDATITAVSRRLTGRRVRLSRS